MEQPSDRPDTRRRISTTAKRAGAIATALISCGALYVAGTSLKPTNRPSEGSLPLVVSDMLSRKAPNGATVKVSGATPTTAITHPPAPPAPRTPTQPEPQPTSAPRPPVVSPRPTVTPTSEPDDPIFDPDPGAPDLPDPYDPDNDLAASPRNRTTP